MKQMVCRLASCDELAAAAYLEMSWRERRKKTQEA